MADDTERVYTIPLGKVLLSPDNRRAMRAINMIREFARRHMKVQEIKIDQALSHEIWARGIRRPPRKVRVRMSKTEEGHVLVSPYSLGKGIAEPAEAAPDEDLAGGSAPDAGAPGEGAGAGQEDVAPEPKTPAPEKGPADPKPAPGKAEPDTRADDKPAPGPKADKPAPGKAEPDTRADDKPAPEPKADKPAPGRAEPDTRADKPATQKEPPETKADGKPAPKKGAPE